MSMERVDGIPFIECTCRTVPDIVVGFFLDITGCLLHDPNELQ